MKIKIGVFDSGVGGESVANAITKAFPGSEVLYVSDSKNIPYGNKSPEKLHELVLPILNKLSKQCDVIVIACNTVTTTLISRLRTELTVPLVGIEPMVKPAAALTKSGVIAVCATPTTLSSNRYHELKKTYAEGVTVIEPDCSDWSYLIESKQIDRSHVQDRIEKACQAGADVIVLACTHYHWIEDIIKEVADDRAMVIQPEEAVVQRLKHVLTDL